MRKLYFLVAFTAIFLLPHDSKAAGNWLAEIQDIRSQGSVSLSTSTWTKIVTTRDPRSNGVMIDAPPTNSADFIITITTYTPITLATTTAQLYIQKVDGPTILSIAPHLYLWGLSLNSAAESIGYIEVAY